MNWYKKSEENSGIVAYHAGKEGFPELKGLDKYRVGYFFSSNKDVVKRWGRSIMSAFLNINNPFIVNAMDNSYRTIPVPKKMRKDVIETLDSVDTDNIGQWAKENGYDGVIINNVVEGNGNTVTATTYIVFDNSQITPINIIGETSKEEIKTKTIELSKLYKDENWLGYEQYIKNLQREGYSSYAINSIVSSIINKDNK